MAKKKILNPRVPRTHNGNTQTKSQFFGSIVSSLRQLSRWWVPIKQAKEEARRPCKKGLQKWEYQCFKCKKWFKEKEIHVDHTIEVGGIRDFKDLPGFAERLFCNKEGFTILCKEVCHREKTNEYMKNKRKKNE